MHPGEIRQAIPQDVQQKIKRVTVVPGTAKQDEARAKKEKLEGLPSSKRAGNKQFQPKTA